jgi:hypothetical protein
LPHCVQASSISLTRSPKTVSKDKAFSKDKVVSKDKAVLKDISLGCIRGSPVNIRQPARYRPIWSRQTNPPLSGRKRTITWKPLPLPAGPGQIRVKIWPEYRVANHGRRPIPAVPDRTQTC